jgi:ferredoxin
VSSDQYEYVIVGAGPCGLSALEELLDHGIDAKSILVIDPNIETNSTISIDQGKKSNIGALGNRRNNGSKFANLSTLTTKAIFPESNFWGASHFPPVNAKTHMLRTQKINTATLKTSTMLNLSGSIEDFMNLKQSGTKKIRQSLQRKEVANHLVNAENSPFFHSLLSINSIEDDIDKCDYSGLCFRGCPTNAFWTASAHLNKILLSNVELNTISDTVVRIFTQENQLEVSSGKKIAYSKLYLGSGPKSSYAILRESNLISNTHKMKNSPVIMVPFFGPKTSFADFSKSFVCCDIILPQYENEDLVGFTQVYFSTFELARNILSTLPKYLNNIEKVISEKFLFLVFKRIGIAMIFGTEQEENRSAKMIQLTMRKNLKYIKNVFPKFRLTPFLIIKKLAINGDSYHIGSIYDTNIESKPEKSNMTVSTLRKDHIYLIDALALPLIPPGPHTFSAMVTARLTVQESLQQ